MNKSRIIGVLVLAMILAMVLAGCGEAKSGTEKTGNGAEVPNPMAQISLSQFQADTGFQVDLYDGYEMGDTYKINTDPIIYGIGITDEDGVEYDVRLANTANLVEISGMNYQWTYTNDEEVIGDEEEDTEEGSETAETAKEAEEAESEEAEVPDYYFYFTEEGQGMITWYEDHYSWSVSATENATKEGMDRMYDDLYGMISY